MQEKKQSKNLKVKKVSIIGVIPSFAFQRAKYCALELHRKLPQRFPLPEIIGMLEFDWNEKLLQWRQTLGREFWCLRRPVAVFFDERFIGSDIELIKLISIGNIIMESIPRKNMSFIKENFRKDYMSYLQKSKRVYCYLDICVDDIYVGTLTFQLYSDLLPRTCENFKSLCLGNRSPLLSYKGSRIHRIVKDGWLQGGDIQYKTGGGGFSIFCDPLEDECFGISHNRRGVLSMANGGRNLNGSQFFITLKPSKWMDTHYVAFGQLIEGVKVLKILENIETLYECPLKKIEIKSCGKLNLQDVEDVDAFYREEPLPKKPKKKIETISEQIVRLIMEALTDALAIKERAPDILDEGDVPSKMNLQLYFQGFYSIPEETLEETAQYLRGLRRHLLRVAKPSATEIVEVIMYNLLMAALTRMVTLEDVRETIGHELYQKMVGGIDMELELCQKPYVKRLVDQIVSTAESMVDLVNKKLLRMKRTSANLKKFRDRMQNWVQSFVLQETFQGDNYHIADRPEWDLFNKNASKKDEEKNEKKHPNRKGKQCCLEEIKKKEKLKAEKLLKKYLPEDICCQGSDFFEMSEIKLSDFFKTCRYGLKRVPKKDKDRMPLLDLIEVSRFNLRWMRRQANRVKTEERLCIEKKIRKWMNEVVYTPETSWIKDSVYEEGEVVFDHVEEIMYGAMTVGLLEMYYFMEEYLKQCGGKKQKLVTRTIYPQESEDTLAPTIKKETSGTILSEEEIIGEVEVKEMRFEEAHEDEKEVEKPACKCGHPCCVCKFDPHYQTPPSPSSLEEEGEKEIEYEGERQSFKEPPPSTVEAEPGTVLNPCGSDMELVDLNAILAEKTSLKPEEIDIRSFRWLKPYILEEGCDLKTEFATQVHKWLEGENFNYNRFISKHSLVTTASLLSLSLSLAELIREENKMKTEIKNFIYDLWDLYFNEMMKEAFLENPLDVEDEKESSSIKEEKEGEGPDEGDKEKEMQIHTQEEVSDNKDLDDECKRIKANTPDFDFDTFCARLGMKLKSINTEDSTRQLSEEQPKKQFSEEQTNTLEETKLPEEVPEPQSKETEVDRTPPSSPKQDLPKLVKPVGSKESENNARNSTQEIPTQNEELNESSVYQEQTSLERDKSHKPDSIESDSIYQEKLDDVTDYPDGVTENLERVKKRKSPIIVQELVDESSSDESRLMPPYVLPFWVKFLTELTKQALGAMAKVSRLPRRLYFLSDSEINFDDKMKEWFEFNAFNPQPTKGREIMDYISLHHRSLTNLEDTARSYLKKKKYSELLNRCTRITSADKMADEIITDVIEAAMNQSSEEETLESFVANLLSSAITSTPKKRQSSYEDDENSFITDQKDSYVSVTEEVGGEQED